MLGGRPGGWTAGLAAPLAQAGDLTIQFAYPNAGETFYAGPSSLIYRLPVKGLVGGAGPDATQVSVELAVYQGDTLLESLAFTPEADGTFERYVTANPHGALEDFTIAFLPCGDTCHRPGEIDLAAGNIRLELSAGAPDGRQARAERQITVDYGRKVSIPVRVLLDGEAAQPVAGVSISADARLYDWRTRSGKGVSDAGGRALVEVEALSEAPTRYRIQVEPSLVDGVLYSGSSVQEITLPPNADSASEIVLSVSAGRGAISGTLHGATPGAGGFPVWAVRTSDGQAHPTVASATGEFSFQNLPIGAYIVAADEQALAQAGLHAGPQTLDLAQQQTQAVELALVELEGEGRPLSGQVRDADGGLLPFAWVTGQTLGETRRVSPLDGAFWLPAPPDQAHTLTAGAPGYYSQALALQPGEDEAGFALVRRPESQVHAWGSGSVLAPPETVAQAAQGRVALERGWLWGQGSGAAWVIQAGAVEIEMEAGTFAIEAHPGQAGWFYLIKGEAVARSGAESVTMSAPQMLALDGAAAPVRLEPAAYALLHREAAPPLPDAWQPNLSAQVRDSLARAGLTTAQALTSLAYGLGALAIPLGLIWLLRRRKHAA